jgi:hypothetical protein
MVAGREDGEENCEKINRRKGDGLSCCWKKEEGNCFQILKTEASPFAIAR